MTASSGSVNNAVASHDVADGEDESRVFVALAWGLLSAVSLQIGSVIGVTCLPKQKTRAMLMSFGGGALLFALSVELFGHALHNYDERVLHGEGYGNAALPVWLMKGFAILGGLFFNVMNSYLNSKGADVRHHATTMMRINNQRCELLRNLILGLWRLPILDQLSFDELMEHVQNGIYRERFSDGDVILSTDSDVGDFYFIVSGAVRVEVYEPDALKPMDGCAPLGRPRQMSKSSRGSKASRQTGPPIGTPRGPAPGSVCSDRLIFAWDLGVTDVFGDMAVLSGTCANTLITAIGDTKVLCLPDHEIEKSISEKQGLRDYVIQRALDRVRSLVMPGAIPSVAREGCSLLTFQPGEVIFNGIVDERTSVMFIVTGCVEVTDEAADWRKVIPTGSLLCDDHLERRDIRPVTATAVEQVLAVVIERSLISFQPMGSPQLQAFNHDLPGQIMPEPVPFEVLSINGVGPVHNKHIMETADMLGWGRTCFDPESDANFEKYQDADGADDACIEHLVTDQEVAEHFLEWNKSSKPNVSSTVSMALVTNDCTSSPTCGALKPSFLDNKELARLPVHHEGQLTVVENSSANGHSANNQAEIEGNSHAAIMIWLGILIDGVPESLIIGILTNKSAEEFGNTAQGVLPFVIGVFLSNLPESMGSAGSMKAHGMRSSTILAMWLAITVLTGIGAALGNALFKSNDGATDLVVASVEGVAAGAMLTMIAQTMMPEAFEQGGDIVGLSCLAGFLCASAVRLIPF